MQGRVHSTLTKMTFSLGSPATVSVVCRKRSVAIYLLVLALFCAGAVTYLSLLYPNTRVVEIQNTQDLQEVEQKVQEVEQKVQEVQKDPAFPGFSGPFTCNPQVPSRQIPNRTFRLARPSTDAHANNKTQPRPYNILRWPTPRYSNVHRVKFDVQDACPYPVSLYPHFSHLNDRFQPNQRWPLGWAPCMLQGEENPRSGTCKDSTGKMITYNYHGNFSQFEEVSVIFMEYLFYTQKGQLSPPFYNEEMFPPRRPHQSWWLLFLGESMGYYPWFGMHAMLDRFDLTIGQPASLFDLPGLTAWLPPYKSVSEENITPKLKRTDAPIAMMISNCNSGNGREEYLKELAVHIPIHSYGACMHNSEVSPEVLEELGIDADVRYNYDVKKHIFKQYKFAIAFENTNCEGYITEKIWNAYEAKAIPIYMGAHDIDQYVPHPDSYLNVANFSSPAALASHILRVAGDYKLEQWYHAWRQPKRDTRTMPPERENSILPQMYRIQEEDLMCRMLSRAVVDE